MIRSDAGSAFGRLRGRRRIGAGWIVGVIGWLTGCADAVPNGDQVAQREVLPHQLISITSPDSGDIIFDRIGGVVVTPDSLLVVGLAGAGQYLIYGPSGRLLRVVGRRGAGPGEFQAPVSFGIRKDSLWVFDRVARRITVFALSTGALIGTSRLTISIPEWPGAGLVYGLLDGGTMLVEGHLTLADGGAPSAVPVGLMDQSGHFVPVGTRDLTGVRFRAAQANGASLVGFQPFVAQPILATTGIGNRFALVEPADTGTTVTMFDGAGQPVYRASLAIDGVELTDSRVDSALRALGPQFRALEAGVIRRPPRLPPVSAAIADNDGSLWLRLDSPWLRRATVRWLVLDPEGGHARTVRVPERHQIRRPVGRTYWAVETDSLDVPRLSRYAWTVEEADR